MQYWVDYLNQALIIGIFAVSVNLLLGYTGIFSIANVAIGGVAGYLAGYLSAAHGWAFLPCLVAGAGAALVVGVLLSFPAMRLSGDYVLLLTLAFASVIVTALVAIPALGGQQGLLGIVPVHLAGKDLVRPNDLLLLAVPAAAICVWVCWRIGHSPFGRVLRGIREDPVAVRALGKNVLAFRVTAFGASSAVAGVAGVILVFYNQLAAPTLFDFDVATTVIAIVVIGGLGNLWGSLIGAAVLVFLEPILERVVAIDPDSASLWRLVIYGALLLVILRVRPAGLLPEEAHVPRLLRRRARRRDGRDDDARRAARSIDVFASAGAASADGRGPGDGAVLSARSLQKHFGGIRAVRGLDLELPPGQVTALVGANGAGKTTVFNLLTGQIRPDSGEVRLLGGVISGLPTHKVVLKGMARSFQDVRTFQRLSVLENVMLGVPGQAGERLPALFLRPWAVQRDERATRARALACLDFVGLAGHADVRAGSLGYGHQKLLAVARLLATGCDVLLIDEPAAGVDRSALEPVMEAIERMRAAGKTICLVEHNLDVVTRLADRVLFMEAGQVTESGTMDDIRQQERLASVYFGHHHA